MIIAGILGSQGKIQTANLINSILSHTGRKVSVIHSKSLAGLNPRLVKDYMSELERNHTDILVVKLDTPDVTENTLHNLNFDVIIYTDKSDDLSETEKARHEQFLRQIFSMMDEKGVAIINLDEGDPAQLLGEMSSHVVTYGFNSKASMTTSSVGDAVFGGSFICCLQRTISARDGKVIEPQEYRLNIHPNDFDRHNVLAAAAFAVVNGVDLHVLDGGT